MEMEKPSGPVAEPDSPPRAKASPRASPRAPRIKQPSDLAGLFSSSASLGTPSVSEPGTPTTPPGRSRNCSYGSEQSMTGTPRSPGGRGRRMRQESGLGGMTLKPPTPPPLAKAE